jgi:hypothetical protein
MSINIYAFFNAILVIVSFQCLCNLYLAICRFVTEYYFKNVDLYETRYQCSEHKPGTNIYHLL